MRCSGVYGGEGEGTSCSCVAGRDQRGWWKITDQQTGLPGPLVELLQQQHPEEEEPHVGVQYEHPQEITTLLCVNAEHGEHTSFYPL